ncbi:MAG: type II toxin-antitoxin system RelE/ParE family toxin [Burkholderiales bacterium]|nr:type II toxin-antitoxin system RelE/ParE family toxin [Pseudomonadota bacterium]
MAQVVYSEQAFADFERIFEFHSASDPDIASEVVSTIREAITILERHPLIGRLAGEELRELLISHRKTGFIALYSYLEREDSILVLALRHQREAGYQVV